MANSFFQNPTGTPGLGFTTTPVTGLVGQSFKTYPAPNTGLATYMLQIRSPQPASTVTASYIFPLSPSSVRKDSTGLTTYYDVAGDASNQGVQRIIDFYGITPVTYTIEGTTGWKWHQTDGYQYTGLQSIQVLENLLTQWANQNQQQIINGNVGLYELWFFDYFRNQFWSVVPIGPQGIRQDERRPILVNYSFRLLGVYPIGAAQVPSADSLATLLVQPPQTTTTTAQQFNNSITTTYGGITAPVQ
jgi:hypothetical protein